MKKLLLWMLCTVILTVSAFAQPYSDQPGVQGQPGGLNKLALQELLRMHTIRAPFKIAPGTTGGIQLVIYEATGTADGTGGFDIDLNIPAGGVILLCQLRVDTLLVGAGAANWSAAYTGGSTQAVATAAAFAKNTKVNTFYDANAASAITTAETDIAVSPDAADLTAGVVRAIVYVFEAITMTDNP